MLSPSGGRPHDAPSSKSPRNMGAGGCDDRVLEWVAGLPTAAELTPLSQQLIPRALAAAFQINIAGASTSSDSPTSHLSFPCDDFDDDEDEGGRETEAAVAPGGGKARKKTRMVWTAELHRRFIEAVKQLGDKAAVPKAIVQVMNVEGITREHVASHLQKYRGYLKRTRGFPFNPKPSSHASNTSDHSEMVWRH